MKCMIAQQLERKERVMERGTKVLEMELETQCGYRSGLIDEVEINQAKMST